MRVALIFLEAPQIDNLHLVGAPQDYARLDKLEMARTFALATHLRDGSSLDPVLICQRDSQLHKLALSYDLPHLAITKSGIFNVLWLWRWQKKNPLNLVLGIGPGSIAMAKKLQSLHAPGKCQLMYAFFLEPPVLNRQLANCVAAAEHCLCGSEFVGQSLLDSLKIQLKNANAKMPGITIANPGMELENYNIAESQTRHGERGVRHFVFGMAESLMPGSGALQTARAMSALWQKKELPAWEVRMFGAGPRFGEILAEACNMGVASRLAILSDQPLSQVSRDCDVWLAPGSSPLELPEVLYAGFASGLPVISSLSSLHRERLAPLGPDCAKTVEVGNPQVLAAAMIEIMTNGALRAQLATRGWTMRTRIGLDAMAGRVINLLEGWLAKE